MRRRSRQYRYPRTIQVRRRSSGGDYIHRTSTHTYGFDGGPTKPTGTVEIPLAVLSDPRIPDWAKVLYGLLKAHPEELVSGTLAEHAEFTPAADIATVEHSVLAAAMSVEADQIRKWLARMEREYNLISYAGQPDKTGPARYRLHWEMMDFDERVEWIRRKIDTG